jgi:transcription elongation factor Elf1
MPISLTIPAKILDKNRPLKFSKHRLEVKVRLWDQEIPIAYEAYLYECLRKHTTYIYRHKDEELPVIVMCPQCGADSQGLTLMWRWEYHSDYTECRGCGQDFNFKKGEPSCKADCPYERVGHAQTYKSRY